MLAEKDLIHVMTLTFPAMLLGSRVFLEGKSGNKQNKDYLERREMV